jgi:hypothetical protein
MRTAAASLIALVLAAAPAAADVPPPSGYVEQCSRERAEKDGEYCVLHRGWHADPLGCSGDAANKPADPKLCGSRGSASARECCKAWLAAGWRYRCKTYGASSFGVLWCRARKPGDAPRPPRSGCAIAGEAQPETCAPLCAFALVLAAARRRRARPRGNQARR